MNQFTDQQLCEELLRRCHQRLEVNETKLRFANLRRVVVDDIRIRDGLYDVGKLIVKNQPVKKRTPI
ncbi:MAG: hypothetical protein ACTHLW_09695 [Verrucomicrobiota bacterium]